MNNLWQVIETNSIIILMSLAVILLLLCISQIFLYRRFKDVHRRYRLLTRGPSGADLEEVLLKYANDVQRLEKQEQELKRNQEILKEQVAQCVQNPGLIRFNAFDNMGSDLSFSIALLDRRGDGVVLTGLYGRDETRIYAKPIRKGTSDYSLADEEAKAVQRSLEKSE